MNLILGFALAICAAVLWGNIIVVATKVGGTSKQQIFGMSIGILFFAIASSMIEKTYISASSFIVGFLSGVFWQIGQINLFEASKKLNVSIVAPICSGVQLIIISFFSIFIFNEWNTQNKIILGLMGILTIIIGLKINSKKENHDICNEKKTKLEGCIKLFISILGYVGYVVLPRFFNIHSLELLLPQAVGLFTISFLFILFEKPGFLHIIRSKQTFLNVSCGILWFFGNFCFLFSQPILGTGIAYNMTHLGLIVSTLGGIFILKEKFTKKEIKWAIAGSIIIAIGAVMIGITRIIN